MITHKICPQQFAKGSFIHIHSYILLLLLTIQLKKKLKTNKEKICTTHVCLKTSEFKLTSLSPLFKVSDMTTEIGKTSTGDRGQFWPDAFLPPLVTHTGINGS